MKIHIPNPCHENWDKMSPEGDGRYCLSCNKVVTDFTQMSIEQIQDYFIQHSDSEICGTFRHDSIELKPILASQFGIYKYLEKINNIAALVMLGIFISFSSCRSKHITGKTSYIGGSADSDNDGVFDIKDDCPYVPGKPEYFGCPDSDGDGIGDSKDSCPFESGLQINRGCPENKDTDNDGIDDRIDNCPEKHGTKANNGCPEIPQHIMGIPQRQTERQFSISYTGDLKFEEGSINQLKEAADIIKKTDNFKITKIKIISSQKEKRSLFLKRKEQLEIIFKDNGVEKKQLRIEKYIDEDYPNKIEITIGLN